MMQCNNKGQTLYIKNMVCDRCIMVVRNLFESLGIGTESVELGTVRSVTSIDEKNLCKLRESLCKLGFELIDDRKQQTTEQIKNEIIKLVHYDNGCLKENLSDFLTEVMHCEYSQLSKLFSETTGTTIEKYFIAQKIERVKELLSYGELSLSQIADAMNYSSVAYLSAQFKSVTGETPSSYKKRKQNSRTSLDKI